MKNKEKQELRSLTSQELQTRIDALKRELFSLRLHAATSPVKDYKQFKKLRHTIARALTYLRQKDS